MTIYHKTSIEITLEVQQVEKAKLNHVDFEPLYNNYFNSIFNFVFHRVSNYDIAGDITSQVFLKALYNIKNYKHKGVPFSAWLFRIASNEINQYYRDKKKRISISIDESSIGNFLSEFDNYDIKENRDIVFIALGKLPSDAVDLIQMRFFEDYSFKEIADILGITENNSKVKVYRILDKMKSIINKMNR
ncbi:MAG: sigma-70 family RNA polymerase sigma factor [Bacteroidota bacterium]